MQYYAHTRQDENGNNLPKEEWQTLGDHLQKTAERAKRFVLPCLENSAYLLGMILASVNRLFKGVYVAKR